MAAATTKISFDKKVDGAIQSFQIALAEKVLKQAVSSGRFASDVSVVTDGVANRDYSQVKPYGRIEFVQQGSLLEVARWIMSELQAKSPYGAGRNGHYRDKHIYLLNGAQVEEGALDRMKPGDVLQIVNTQPYAGKIEGRDAFTRWDIKSSSKNRFGLTRRGIRLKQQGWSRSSIQGESAQAPNGVYRVVLKEAAARYGRLVNISYAPVQLSLGVSVWGQEGGRRWSAVRPRKRILRPQIYPCFTIVSKALAAP